MTFDDPTWQDADRESPRAQSPEPEAAKDADGKPVLDFLTFADADAQAKAIGGTVVASGVAFHVEKD